MSDVTNTLLATHERIDAVASLFVTRYAIRISPIWALEKTLFGQEEPVGQQKAIILEGAVVAAEELWENHREDAARLANEAIDQALAFIRSSKGDPFAMRRVIERALPLIHA